MNIRSLKKIIHVVFYLYISDPKHVLFLIYNNISIFFQYMAMFKYALFSVLKEYALFTICDPRGLLKSFFENFWEQTLVFVIMLSHTLIMIS